NRTSSSRSRTMRSAVVGSRNARRTPAGICMSVRSTRFENAPDGRGIAAPRGRFGAQLRAAARGERVVLRAAIVVRQPPLGFDGAAVFEAMQCLVERRVDDHQLTAAALSD